MAARPFPRHEGIQAAFREAAGPQLVTPGRDAGHGTQAAAIEWWLRFGTDPAPSMALPARGIAEGLAAFGRRACFDAARRLLVSLGVRGSLTAPTPADPRLFAQLDDERQARVCYARPSSSSCGEPPKRSWVTPGCGAWASRG